MSVDKKEQETLLQTIRARIERIENGPIVWVPDPNGNYKIISSERLGTGLYKYFESNMIEDFDKFGFPE